MKKLKINLESYGLPVTLKQNSMDSITHLPPELIKQQKKILLIDPYLDSLGGGERYILTLAEWLLSEHCRVDILWPESHTFTTAAQKFSLNLQGLNPVHYAINSPVSKFTDTRQYDVIFTISDGSLPIMFGKKNIVHFQVPFHDVEGQSLGNWLKKQTIHHFITNSQFTKTVVDNEYGIQSEVIYPPVDVQSFNTGKKLKQIVYVGRFSNLLQQKAHHILIEAFTRLLNSGITDYQLKLAGSTEIGAEDYVQRLQQQAQGLPIEIITNPSFSDLQKLYGQSQFFWSASGYGIDELQHPEQCEHFGISVVEAMAAGCIPLILNKGGHKEIIASPQHGFLWDELDELVHNTKQLIAERQQTKKLQQHVQERAKQFSNLSFINSWKQILYA